MTASAVINVQPINEEVVDVATDFEILFEIASNGITHYNITFYDLSNGNQAYTTGRQSIPSSPANTGNTRNITIEGTNPSVTLSNNNTYSYSITVYEGSGDTTGATTRRFVIVARANPVITLDSRTALTSVEVTFTDTYTQADDPLDFFRVRLFLSNGTEVDDTGNVFGNNISYTFGSFLSGQSYHRIVSGQSVSGNTFSVTSVTFTVTYDQGQVEFLPSVTQSNTTSVVDVEWSAVNTVVGTVQGGSVSYNDGVVIPSGVTVSFNGIDATTSFTIDQKTTLGSNFNGVIISNALTSPTYVIGYDNSVQKFYLDNNGYRIESVFFPLNQIEGQIRIIAQQFIFYLIINGQTIKVVT